jgi:hypothetical protein
MTGRNKKIREVVQMYCVFAGGENFNANKIFYNGNSAEPEDAGCRIK